jgi:hypothetical protein
LDSTTFARFAAPLLIAVAAAGTAPRSEGAAASASLSNIALSVVDLDLTHGIRVPALS